PYHREAFARKVQVGGFAVAEDWVDCVLGPDIVSPDRYETEGRAMTARLFEQCNGRLPEGLIIKDDMLARGVCTELENRGVVVGRDIKILSQANADCDVLQDWEDRLFLIEFDSSQIVEAMFSELESLMEQPNDPRPPVAVRGRLKV
ncbi:MAG: substrate-binding domain-containing protein, partial [Puniceicoccales bacterium]